jgi:hypothetical protein
MRRAPTMTINGVKISYVQIPYHDRFYKVRFGSQALYVKDLRIEDFFQARPFEINIDPAIMKRWHAFRKRVEDRNRSLDRVWTRGGPRIQG